MESVYRTLTLRGATGKLRAARLHGKDYLVVPVTALVEAVIHPLGSAGRGEFVSRKVLRQSVDTWNGRPVVPDHPVNAAGQLVSANLPEVMDTQSFGMTFNAQFQNEKELHMEAWLDPDRAEIVGANAMDVINRVRAGQPVEVSVGGYVQYVEKDGRYGDQDYGVEWMQITSDHLAVGLNGGRGACSVEMGCGAMRGNAENREPIYNVTPDGLVAAAWQDQPRDPIGRWTDDNAMSTPQVASLSTFQQWREKVSSLLKSFEVMAFEPVVMAVPADGTPVIEPPVIDTPVAPVTPVAAAGECGCQHKQEPQMHRNADKIKALIEDPKTPFKAEDQTYLEALTDDRLAEFAPKAETPAAPVVEPVVEPKALSLAEVAAAVKALNDDEFVALLPEEARAMVVAGRAAAKARREKMMAGLKAATKDAYSDAELAGMTGEQLDKLAKAVGFDPEAPETPVVEEKPVGARVYDWSGFGGARAVPEGVKLSDFTPPDPWAEAINKRKGA